MNASELADKLEARVMSELPLKEAATMLRQQQTSLISDVDVIERQYKEIQVKDEAIFNSQKQAYNLAMQVQNQKALIKQLEETQVYLYKTHDADKAEIEAFKNKECSCNVNTVNNEPVAWRRVIGNVTKHYEYNEVGVGEPLYSLETVRLLKLEIEHQKERELTDGEIMSEWEESKDEVDFARAILRKASEK